MPFTLILQTEQHYYKPVASSVSLVLLFQLFRATIKKKMLLVKMARKKAVEVLDKTVSPLSPENNRHQTQNKNTNIA